MGPIDLARRLVVVCLVWGCGDDFPRASGDAGDPDGDADVDTAPAYLKASNTDAFDKNRTKENCPRSTLLSRKR